MKKIIALIVCLAVLCTLSVSAFAAVKSPEIKALARKAIGVKVIEKCDTWYDASGNVHVAVKADKATYGTFTSWMLYKEDGSKATQGVDYELVNCTLESEQVEFVAKTNIIVCGNYNGVITDPTKPSQEEKKPEEKKEEKSDKTGDSTAEVASVLLLAGACFALASKKVFAK